MAGKQEQLATWRGEFGRAYTDRNPVDWKTILPAFGTMLNGLKLTRILEVGCNRGHNLVAIGSVLGSERELVGVEPNRYALEIAGRAGPGIRVLGGTVYDLPFRGEVFDLVFTSCVLIHVPLSELPRALSEIHRVSGRYIMALEYYAKEETEIPYRGYQDLLWKRDFLRHYLDLYPRLVLVRHGFWGPEHGFDSVTWWLLEKPSAS